VTLPFSASDLPPGATTADVEILTAPEGSTNFVSLGGTLLDATHIQTTTLHFSQFVAAAHRHDRDAGTVTPDAGSPPLDGGSPSDGGTVTDGGGSSDAGVADGGTCGGCYLADGGGCSPGFNPTACGLMGAVCVDCLSMTPAKQCFQSQPSGGYCN
jgi:hypothetical protein